MKYRIVLYNDDEDDHIISFKFSEKWFLNELLDLLDNYIKNFNYDRHE